MIGRSNADNETSAKLQTVQQYSFQHLRPIIVANWRAVINGFVTDVVNEFLVAASHANTQHQRPEYILTLNLLKKHRNALEEKVPLAMATRLVTALAKCHKQEDADKLSLLSDKELENKLLARKIAHRLEARQVSHLKWLNQYLSKVFEIEFENTRNPLAPAYLTELFFVLFLRLPIPAGAQPILYRAFERTLNRRLGGFYQQVVDLFKKDPKARQITEADLNQTSARTSSVSGQRTKAPESARLEKPDAPGVSAAQKEKPAASRYVAPQHKSGGYPPPRLLPNPVGLDNPRASAASLQAIHDLNKLLQVTADLQTGSLIKDPADKPSETPAEHFSKKQIDEAINKLLMVENRHIRRATSLLDTINRQLLALYPDHADTRFSDIHKNLIEITDRLFTTMSTDRELSDEVREWSALLKVPFLKLIINDPSFVDNAGHPARRVLNNLVRLGSISSRLSVRLKTTLERLIEGIAMGGEAAQKALASECQTLQEMFERQQKLIGSNKQRITDAYQGQVKIRKAKQQVNLELQKILHAQQVPDIALTLVEDAWANHLTIVGLKEGADSAQFHQGLELLKRLIEGLRQLIRQSGPGDAELKDLHQLVTEIEGELQHSGGHSEYSQLIQQLSEKILDSRTIELIKVPKQWSLADPNAKVASRPAGSSPPAKRWLQRAKDLQPGEWIRSDLRGHPEQSLQLAWTDQSHYCFVYLSGQAIKQLETSMLELAEGLEEGDIHIINHLEVPFVDRVLNGIIEGAHQTMTSRAVKDNLTGLLNRYEFEKRVQRAVTNAREIDTEHVMCHLDIDHFNLINEGHGTQEGDKVLIEVADNLVDLKPDTASICRLDGDSFGILLEDCDQEVGLAFAERMRKQVRSHFSSWGKGDGSVTVSIGLVLIDNTTDHWSQVLQQAKIACDQAKRKGRNRVIGYMENADDEKLRKKVIGWISMIDQGLDNDWLELRCQKIQPVKSVATTKPHYEILLGVNDKQGDNIPVAEFISAAEHYNRMPKVDIWVVSSVIKWMRSNPEAVKKLDGLSINLSGQSINDDRFLELLLLQINSADVPLDKICFEVTETATIENLGYASDFVNEIRRAGCRFSLDDFGTGMSSYAYLHQLQVDYLKIDGVFVKDIESNQTNYGLVKSVNELAHLMGKQTIAEYVESQEIAAILTEIGVDHLQGWAIGKPLKLDSLAE